MKIIKKISIFVITCVFAIAMYFAFGVERVDADSTTPSYSITGSIAVLDDIDVRLTISWNLASDAINIEGYTCTYKTMINNTLVTKTASESEMQNPSSSYSFDISVAAPAIFEEIVIVVNNNSSYTYYTSVADLLFTEKGTFGSGSSKNKVCCDLILYGYYTASYFSNTVNSSWKDLIGINGQANSDSQIYSEYLEIYNAANASDEDKANIDFSSYEIRVTNHQENKDNFNIHIVGLNFDCSSNCKLYVYFSGTDQDNNQIDMSDYTVVSTGKIPTITYENNNEMLKAEIQFNFSELLNAAGTMQIVNINDQKMALYDFDIYPLSYAYAASKKYDKADLIMYICYCLYRLGTNAVSITE